MPEFDDAWNHISDQPSMEKDTISRQKRGLFSALCSFPFGKNESQDIKQCKKNVAILL